jgi:hypothetical protein
MPRSGRWGTSGTNVGSEYTAEEHELLTAMQRYRAATGIMFPHVTDFLHVAKWLGYRKVENRGKPDELTRKDKA